MTGAERFRFLFAERATDYGGIALVRSPGARIVDPVPHRRTRLDASGGWYLMSLIRRAARRAEPPSGMEGPGLRGSGSGPNNEPRPGVGG